MFENLTLDKGIPIKFNYNPYRFKEGMHTVEKASADGNKHRYLCGVTSGIDKDVHDEKMTIECIQGFHEQAQTEEILLYTDVHGIQQSQDIGKLVHSEILQGGDWYTEYRLYDESDDVGEAKLEIIDTLWKQINGLPPYAKPRQKGFSVEGYIPKEAVEYTNAGQVKRGVLKKVILVGVVLVPNPAYKGSIATSIYKAMGETSPERKTTLKESLVKKLEMEQASDSYYKEKWKFQDALESTIEKIMKKPTANKLEELEYIFDEYKSLMIPVIMQSEKLFALKREQEQPSVDVVITKSRRNAVVRLDPKTELLQQLSRDLKTLAKSMEE